MRSDLLQVDRPALDLAELHSDAFNLCIGSVEHRDRVDPVGLQRMGGLDALAHRDKLDRCRVSASQPHQSLRDLHLRIAETWNSDAFAGEVLDAT